MATEEEIVDAKIIPAAQCEHKIVIAGICLECEQAIIPVMRMGKPCGLFHVKKEFIKV